MSALEWQDPIARKPRRDEDVLLLFQTDGRRYLHVARHDGSRWVHPGTSAAFGPSPIVWASIPLPGSPSAPQSTKSKNTFVGHINGWLRLGIALSIAWFAFFCLLVAEAVLLSNRNGPSLVEFFAYAFGPIVGGWLLTWLAVIAVRWIIAGFLRSRPPSSMARGRESPATANAGRGDLRINRSYLLSLAVAFACGVLVATVVAVSVSAASRSERPEMPRMPSMPSY